MSPSKTELESDNTALREEVARLIDSNQVLQARAEDLANELYTTQILELNKRRELDAAQEIIRQTREELTTSNSQSSPSLLESSSPSQGSPVTP